MTTPTLARRAAEAIVRVTAQWLRPTRRREWGSAMRAELAHIEDDHEALRFAYGCAVAAITLRSTTMHFGTLKVSRFVLALEMALCFVPMTFGWLDFVFGASGVAWLDAAAVERYYLGTAEGVAAFAKVVAGALIGILGRSVSSWRSATSPLVARCAAVGSQPLSSSGRPCSALSTWRRTWRAIRGFGRTGRASTCCSSRSRSPVRRISSCSVVRPCTRARIRPDRSRRRSRPHMAVRPLGRGARMR
jgi:hypothetical protein